MEERTRKCLSRDGRGRKGLGAMVRRDTKAKKRTGAMVRKDTKAKKRTDPTQSNTLLLIACSDHWFVFTRTIPVGLMHFLSAS